MSKNYKESNLLISLISLNQPTNQLIFFIIFLQTLNVNNELHFPTICRIGFKKERTEEEVKTNGPIIRYKASSK